MKRDRLVEIAHKGDIKVAHVSNDNLIRKIMTHKRIRRPGDFLRYLADRLHIERESLDASALLKKIRASPEFEEFMKPKQNVSPWRKFLVKEAKELKLKSNRVTDDDLIRDIIRAGDVISFKIIHHLATRFGITDKPLSFYKIHKSKEKLNNEMQATDDYKEFMKPKTKARKYLQHEVKTSAADTWTPAQIIKYANWLDIPVTKDAKEKKVKALQMLKAKILKDPSYSEIILSDIQDPNEVKKANIDWSEVKAVESKFQVQSALKKWIRTHTLEPDQAFKDTLSFFKSIKPYAVEVLQDELEEKKNLKYRINIIIQNYNPITEAEDVRHLSTNMTILLQNDNISRSYDEVVAVLEQRIQDDQAKGSGWVINKIMALQIIVNQYQPITGGSYIPLPDFVANKKACINVKNEDDLCFRYAILAALHPPAKNAERVSKYKDDHDIVFAGLEYPVRVNSIDTFEKRNNLAINIYGLKKEKVEILRISKVEGTPVNLLLLEDRSRQHYVTIKNMSRFMQLISPSQNGHKRFPCHKCLHLFTSENAYTTHIEIGCGEIQETLPVEGKNTMEFTGVHKQLPYPFVAVADFEALTVQVNDTTEGSTKKYQVHEPCGYAVQLTSDFMDLFLEWDRSTAQKSIHDDTPFNLVKPFSIERSKDAIEIFLKTVNHMAIRTNEFVKQHAVGGALFKPMVLTEADDTNATHCHICDKPLKLIRRLDHCHFTGKFRGVAHNLCNLNYNYQNTKLTVVFHNFEKYDGHLLIKEIHKISKSLKPIAKTSERYMALTTENIRFIDSIAFMADSLDNLSKSLEPADLKNLTNHFPNPAESKLLSRKGVYPYDYMDSWAKFEETTLPPQSAFFSKLSQSNITDSEYAFAHTIWNAFECKTMGDYHDLYLKTDVLLLADVFTRFRKAGLTHNGLDPAHYVSIPSYAWDSMLKRTGVTINLITDVNMYRFFEKGIRGGISVISHRHAVANNKYLQDHDPTKPSNYIVYMDANALYASAMSEKLPIGDFKWVDFPIEDLLSFDANGDHGLALEVDLDYPSYLHYLHNDYPLAPESIAVKESDLSPYAKSLMEEHKIKLSGVSKLIPNLKNKKNYIVHIKNLQEYIKRGLVVTKIHRAIQFKQSAWLKTYIDFNTERRQDATTKFDKDFYKLMNNAVFGKTMENMRNRRNFHLVTTAKKANALARKPTFKSATVFGENLVGIEQSKLKVKLNKPIAAGFSILDLSKLVMYGFHYDTIKTKYGNKAKLLFTDTDSLCYDIETEDLYKDFESIKDQLDTSDYPKDHPLYSEKNKKVVGKFKDETNGEPITEFVGLRAKVYALSTPTSQTKKAKGVKKSVVKKDISIDDYRNTLLNEKIMVHSQHGIKSSKHKLHSIVMKKISLSCFDDKRFLTDSVNTLAYGHTELDFYDEDDTDFDIDNDIPIPWVHED